MLASVFAVGQASIFSQGVAFPSARCCVNGLPAPIISFIHLSHKRRNERERDAAFLSLVCLQHRDKDKSPRPGVMTTRHGPQLEI